MGSQAKFRKVPSYARPKVVDVLVNSLDHRDIEPLAVKIIGEQRPIYIAAELVYKENDFVLVDGGVGPSFRGYDAYFDVYLSSVGNLRKAAETAREETSPATSYSTI